MTIDELSLEATKEYSKKMGRWRRKALEVTSSNFFWALLLVMNTACAPLIHYSNFLKQKIQPGDEGKLSSIVNNKCNQILLEFWSLLFHNFLDHEFFDALSLVETAWLQRLTFQVICKNASQFFRRHLLKTTQYPLKLFGLIKSAPNRACKLRQNIARELLDLHRLRMEPGGVSSLDLCTTKILEDKMFNKQILEATTSGMLGSELHALLSLVSRYAKVDVRENERINKLLSMLGKSCPNSNLVS